MRSDLPGIQPGERMHRRRGHRCGNGLSEMMLDRYGIRYVCQHPEILFSESVMPASEPARPAYGGYLDLDYVAPDVPVRRHDIRQTGTADDMLSRAAEAYRLLNEIYAPWPAPSTERRARDNAGSRYVQPR